jgi:murein DD-endopeptidase MepM/ murein hydrolase activator NlpD
MPFPLFGKALGIQDYCKVYLGPDTCPADYGKTADLGYTEAYIRNEMQARGVDFGIGGYAEERAIYRGGVHFVEGEPRCIHLGLDFWTAAGTEVHAPWDAEVHSFSSIDLPYDYGHVVILRHHLPQGILHSLYGHLSADSLKGLEEGKRIPAGKVFARLGTAAENGGWPPHLHFQLIRDMMGKEGDFPGVCTKGEKAFYLDNCPKPTTDLYLA